VSKAREGSERSEPPSDTSSGLDFAKHALLVRLRAEGAERQKQFVPSPLLNALSKWVDRTSGLASKCPDDEQRKRLLRTEHRVRAVIWKLEQGRTLSRYDRRYLRQFLREKSRTGRSHVLV